ncbi:MAG: glycosyltransferase 36 [Kangiellaceae bacterium]|nr:glycosyltransferase 36 [Kangiellaceae bacterium]
MLVTMNCRGYSNAQFLQPEPAKYSYGPNIEATTFMQPEPHYYAHHPGRFFYLKDEQTGELFSAPFEPTRVPLDAFEFSIGAADLCWTVTHLEIEIKIKLSLPESDCLEIWQIEVINLSNRERKISVYPYFSIGYMSWMNQSANYLTEHNAIVATSIRPYQRLTDYYKNIDSKDKTFLMSAKNPTAFCANQASFEGEGGMHAPDQVKEQLLCCSIAQYEVPVAAMQFRLTLSSGDRHKNTLLFGPVKQDDDLDIIKRKYFSNPSNELSELDRVNDNYQRYIGKGKGCLSISTPDKSFDEFVNHWLPRQMFYHGDVNRLTSDPQTRNYLQDNMGMSYIDPSIARAAFLKAISQQHKNGSMPDGILLRPDAELKYINQIPHSDHSVWLPICLIAYLNETNDYALLNEMVCFQDDSKLVTVGEHIDLAMDWLINNRDHRGLSLIAQGDWCDPMNMVGHKGKGVSAWLTMATSYALKTWSIICLQANRAEQASRYSREQESVNNQINQYFWDENWYARGITDEGVTFGIESDEEGCIYLNPQSWAILSDAADENKISKMLAEVAVRLETPFGPMMLSPAYTKMREDVGRLTQKSPGVAENGSIYNHASIFYAFSLYQANHKGKAFEVLKKMLPTEQDVTRRGQLPNHIPNYYRGAVHQFPDHAGRSSQLFNTGTVSWYYRCLVEGLFGLKGQLGDLVIEPSLPDEWEKVSVSREYMGATFELDYLQSEQYEQLQIIVNDKPLNSNRITDIEKGKHYRVIVNCPKN